jgi:hypothetical protein
MINIISWSTRQTYCGWSSFKLMHELQRKCLQHFTSAQKVMHKDTKHGFGVLQVWFQIFANPCRQWDYKIIVNILMVCVVLHNMILEDEHDE